MRTKQITKLRVGLTIAVIFALGAWTAANAETLASFSDSAGQHSGISCE